MDTLDRNTFDALKEAMGEKFPTIVQKYIETSKGYIDSISSSITSNDLQSLGAAAHPMKSSSAMLGLTAVSKTSEKIENISNRAEEDSSVDVNDLPALFAELQAQFAAVLPLLEEEV
jgi:HPt (histidine-containing phosphotransfer) domain-containing protein